MKMPLFLLPIVWSLSALCSCSTDSKNDTAAYCRAPITVTDDDGSLLVIAEDKYNYSFESSVEIQSVKVRSLSDIRFDWSEVTKDMLGRPFDPQESVDMMELTLWHYSKEDLMRDINDDSLDKEKLVTLGWMPTDNAVSEGNLLDLMSPNGGDVDDAEILSYVDTVKYPPSDYHYLIMAAEGDSFGYGTKMLSFFEPNPNVSDTEVAMNDSSTVIHYEADLSSLVHIPLPPNEPNIVLDWMDNTILLYNAMGREWIPTKITDVIVAHYLTKTAKDLETDFLNLEADADKIWTIFLSAGQSVNFSKLNTKADGSGEFFPGIDEIGTWIVALKCGSCSNPAPLFLSILDACP
jgi:hypothetical protein